MKITGIYKIESKIRTDRIYIGSAVNISERWRLHLVGLRNNKHHSGKLQRHYNKYGRNDLQFSILIGCDSENLLSNEQFFIDSYKPYFNNCKIAGSSIGIIRSKVTKEKIRISKSGTNHPNWGKHLTEETKSKIRKSLMGHESSEERNNKISKVHKGKTFSEERKKKLRGIKRPYKKRRFHNRVSPTEETRKKMREAKLGKKRGLYKLKIVS